MNRRMRIPTPREYDQLVEVTGGDNKKMHWERMYSFVYSFIDDAERQCRLPVSLRENRGYTSARSKNRHKASHWNATLGFRPAVDLSPKDLPSGIKVGDSLVLGTLYMNGNPVHVPENYGWKDMPKDGGDVENYVPDATLELKEPLEDPKYQMTGFYVGEGVAVADRAMLNMISYLDITSGILKATQSLKRTEDLIMILRGLDTNALQANMDAAIVGYYLYREEYPDWNDLTELETARLADLLSCIPRSDYADDRFSSYDYMDALLHTKYQLNVQRLMDLGTEDYEQFTELMNELAAQKRAVYEDVDYDDENLLALLKETGVGKE